VREREREKQTDRRYKADDKGNKNRFKINTNDEMKERKEGILLTPSAAAATAEVGRAIIISVLIKSDYSLQVSS